MLIILHEFSLAEWGRRRVKKRNIVRQPDIRNIGYARVSTAEQNLQMQIDALLREGVHPDNLHVEKVSGVSARRPKLELALMDAREGVSFTLKRRCARALALAHTQLG